MMSPIEERRGAGEDEFTVSITFRSYSIPGRAMMDDPVWMERGV